MAGKGGGLQPGSCALSGVQVLPDDSVVAGFPNQRATTPEKCGLDAHGGKR